MRVYDSKRFHYEVEVEHLPLLGTSRATYQGQTIARRDYSRGPLPPCGDSDAENEGYQDQLAEWCDAAEADLLLKCQEHFNKTL